MSSLASVVAVVAYLILVIDRIKKASQPLWYWNLLRGDQVGRELPDEILDFFLPLLSSFKNPPQL